MHDNNFEEQSQVVKICSGLGKGNIFKVTAE